MTIEEVTLAVFTATNAARILAYLPQIRKAAVDDNGAMAISYSTWLLFFVGNASTAAYSIVNQSDPILAACFSGNAVCCLAIVVATFMNRRRFKRGAKPFRSPLSSTL